MSTEKKIHVGLLFGGNSSEHDVSKRSAHNIFDAMDKERYEVSLFMVTKDGYLLSDASSRRIFDGESEDKVVADAMKSVDKGNPLSPILNLSEQKDIDVYFPIIHGNLGEDGTIQGLLRLLQKPYVGSGILASAVSFDKDTTKQLLTHNGIRNTKYVVVTPENRGDYSYDVCRELLGELMFLKPANQGSSVGIHKATNAQEFETGLDDAFRYDFKVLVEQSIEQPEEVEVSILGNRNPKASKVGRIIVPKSDTFYDYNNKFVDASGVQFELPASISSELSDEVQQMALDAFRVLGCCGLARIDFLVDHNKVPYLSEINTLPGFTNISLYPQLWEVSGISYERLIDQLIDLAFEEFNRRSKIHYDFTPLDAE
ncbi:MULTISPECIES: D-alanine--D-alanine ligase family protein [Pediococcus]|uniref:D-alanine--D-alanine ligase family protein n=1 Tax=Pediococcus TaxID=1253 RepID=UPI000E94F53F|nr:MULTISPECIES: D-alanine--D-alanine ligase family protein [Pediococcus]MCT3029705.1 D-alanine--D-alanine ligase [Pediococcus parvulus]HBO48148.1 D-alanine--D-alanine ligase [Pediococcus sp.]